MLWSHSYFTFWNCKSIKILFLNLYPAKFECSLKKRFSTFCFGLCFCSGAYIPNGQRLDPSVEIFWQFYEEFTAWRWMAFYWHLSYRSFLPIFYSSWRDTLNISVYHNGYSGPFFTIFSSLCLSGSCIWLQQEIDMKSRKSCPCTLGWFG